jgi:hypothetical protein
MDYIRVRTLYLLPGSESIEPIYSGTFDRSDHAPQNPSEEPYMHRRMEQDFNDRAWKSENAGRDESDEEESDEEAMEEPDDGGSNAFAALGLKEQDALRERIDQIKRASPRSPGGIQQDLPVRKTRKIPTGAPTTPPPPEVQGKRKRSFGRRVSDQARRLICLGERSSSPIEEETSPTVAVKERLDKRSASLAQRFAATRDGLKDKFKRGRGGDGCSAA